jgi:hypothetical protein
VNHSFYDPQPGDPSVPSAPKTAEVHRILRDADSPPFHRADAGFKLSGGEASTTIHYPCWLVRMLEDVYPIISQEYQTVLSSWNAGVSSATAGVFTPADRIIKPNARRQLYLHETGDFVDDPNNDDIVVQTYGTLPLIQNDLVEVWYHEPSDCHLPAAFRLAGAVRIPTPGVLNAAGFQDGYLQLYQADQNILVDGPLVHVVDLNSFR